MPEITYTAPTGYGFSDQGALVLKSNAEYKYDTYTEPGGYVTLITRAYQFGIYDGHIVYKIESEARIEKNFFSAILII